FPITRRASVQHLGFATDVALKQQSCHPLKNTRKRDVIASRDAWRAGRSKAEFVKAASAPRITHTAAVDSERIGSAHHAATTLYFLDDVSYSGIELQIAGFPRLPISVLGPGKIIESARNTFSVDSCISARRPPQDRVELGAISFFGSSLIAPPQRV